ncbi:hypothetical protein D3C78_1878980 [compost metagenome]
MQAVAGTLFDGLRFVLADAAAEIGDAVLLLYLQIRGLQRGRHGVFCVQCQRGQPEQQAQHQR